MFYNPDCDFKTSGYTETKVPKTLGMYSNLDQAYKSLHINEADDIPVQYSQNEPFKLSDGQATSYPATQAMFKNSVNAKDGVVVALDNKSPAGLNPRPKEIPRLQKWSDVEALRVSKHTAIPTYDNKITFSMETAEGQAILGAPVGAGCGWLVAQHKEQLGVKTITEVVLWADDEWNLEDIDEDTFILLSMYFTVKPVSADGRIGAREL